MNWLKLSWLLLSLLPSLALAQLSPADVYRSTSNSVVLIISHHGAAQSKGTGSVIAPGLVLTNAHVVLDDQGQAPQKLLIFLKQDNLNDDSRRIYEKGRRATVVRTHQDLDLALLKVDGLDDVSPLTLGDSSQMEIGAPVLAIGHPENGGLWSLTSGRIGSRIRNHGGVSGRHVFQTETSLNRGNSGGPLLNYDGQIIGINTSIARKSADGLAITGVNFSVQSNVARDWLERGGVSMAAAATAPPVAKTPVGIRRVTPENPAQQALPETPLPESPLLPPDSLEQVNPNDLLGAAPEGELLTPPRPFKDQDLFQSLMDQQEDDFDRLMDQQESSFDQKMDAAFDSF